MTSKFSLLRPEDKNGKTKVDPVSIVITVCNKNSRVSISTGFKIQPKFWNDAGKAKSSYIKCDELNADLALIEDRLVKAIRLHPTAKGNDLKAIVRDALYPVTVEKKTVHSFIDSFILNSTKKNSTIRSYRNTRDHLTVFCEKKNIDLKWDSFDFNFYESFVDFLYKQGHVDNSVGKTIKILKTFLSSAFERDLHSNLNFKKKWFKVIHSEADEIYLSEDELIQFLNADVSKTENPWLMERVKKIFVFGCWVGLRYGDLSRLNPYHITNALGGGKLIKITTEKTGEDVMIPLLPIADEIWTSWKGFPPKLPNNAHFNKYIKEIAELAKINNPVQKRTTIKGKVSIEWVPKYAMVKAHTMRRSFATNCYLLGIDKQDIMSTTGHRTEKSFLKYIRVSKEQHASRMAAAFRQPKDDAVMKKAN